MIELVYALVVLGWLGLIVLPGPETQMLLGWIFVAAGLLGGGGAGLVYHHALRAALRRHGGDIRGWWWKPVSFHARLNDGERPRVLRWFRGGALGFFICITGIALVVAATLRAAYGA